MAGLSSKVGNHVLGRGEVHVASFQPNTQYPAGYRYLGNTPAFGWTTTTQMLDHFSMDHGIKERDQSVPLEITRKGTLEADNIDFDNLAFLVFGAAASTVVSGGSVSAEAVPSVIQGLSYYLGVSDNNPIGAGALTFHTGSSGAYCVVKDAVPTTYTEGTDYTVDVANGSIFIVPGGAIASGTTLAVDYKVAPQTVDSVISGSTPIEGAVRFIADNPAGSNINYLFPWVKITPNGEFTLKSDTWQVMKFDIEILKRVGSGVAAVYINGVPFIDS